MSDDASLFSLTKYVQVFPYTECGMGMESQEYTKSVLQPKLFVEKTCTQVCSLVMVMPNELIAITLAQFRAVPSNFYI